MSGRISAATERALALIGQPRPDGGKWNAVQAAKACGISPSTLYRQLARIRRNA